MNMYVSVNSCRDHCIQFEVCLLFLKKLLYYISLQTRTERGWGKAHAIQATHPSITALKQTQDNQYMLSVRIINLLVPVGAKF